MQAAIMVRYGEIALKGRNRHIFEQQLQQNMQGALQRCEAKVQRMQGRILVTAPQEELDQIMARLRMVFGVVSLSIVHQTALDINEIKAEAVKMVEAITADKNSFKVKARRANKKFAYDSPRLNDEIGGHLQERFPGLAVDLHQPLFTLEIEIGFENAFLYLEKVPGLGGLPVGTSGSSLLLLSGGIDSPVAGWLALKRGLRLEALHFHSFPFTGKKALQKAGDLCSRLALYGHKVPLHTVSVTAIQKELRENCPEQLAIILLRRMMFRIAEAIAVQRKLQALITGESLGQVASQTLHSLQAIEDATGMLVLRPLVTMDKQDIIKIASEIATYDISIRPYEDCCTLFVPRSPVTRPKIDALKRAEAKLNTEKLVEEALLTMETVLHRVDD